MPDQGDHDAGRHGARMPHAEPTLFMVLSVCFTTLSLILPWGGLALLVLTPFPILILAVTYHWGYAVSLVSIESAVCWSVGGLPSWLLFAQYNLPPLMMASIIRRGGSMPQTIAGGVAVLGLGGVVLGGLYALTAQESLGTLFERAMNAMVLATQDSLRLLAQPHEVDEDQLQLVRAELASLIRAIFPAMLVLHYGMMNTLTYLVVRGYYQHVQPPRYLDPADVSHWQSWEYLVWVFLGSGAALFMPVTVVSTVALNVFLITLAIYCMHGAAIALFWGRRLPLSFAVRMLLTIMVCMIAGPFCIVGCTLVGLFDLWVDFRRLRRPLAL